MSRKKKKLLTINHTFWSQIKSRMDKEYSNMKDWSHATKMNSYNNCTLCSQMKSKMDKESSNIKGRITCQRFQLWQ
jgi:hypothetical protein